MLVGLDSVWLGFFRVINVYLSVQHKVSQWITLRFLSHEISWQRKGLDSSVLTVAIRE